MFSENSFLSVLHCDGSDFSPRSISESPEIPSVFIIHLIEVSTPISFNIFFQSLVLMISVCKVPKEFLKVI